VKVERTEIPEVLLLEPKVFPDERGMVFESYNRRAFAEAAGVDPDFVQDNRSISKQNVLRGLHYQVVKPQGKLVQVLRGEIFDVAVDLRKSSRTFGKWVGFRLSAANRRMAWIPPGFAHGLLALSDVDVLYKMTELWMPQHDRTNAWNDPAVGIDWPAAGKPMVSAKDAAGVAFEKAELFA
jgi:dTDP-4-dehydrorhamnose 3,5-epimerase